MSDGGRGIGHGLLELLLGLVSADVVRVIRRFTLVYMLSIFCPPHLFLQTKAFYMTLKSSYSDLATYIRIFRDYFGQYVMGWVR